LLCLASTGLGYPGNYNATTDENRVVCVYPLSEQYGGLARLLFCQLLIFSVVAYKQVWLVAGALAYAMTYSGTAAVHVRSLRNYL
jgi:hypothetical protein